MENASWTNFLDTQRGLLLYCFLFICLSVRAVIFYSCWKYNKYYKKVFQWNVFIDIAKHAETLWTENWEFFCYVQLTGFWWKIYSINFDLTFTNRHETCIVLFVSRMISRDPKNTISRFHISSLIIYSCMGRRGGVSKSEISTSKAKYGLTIRNGSNWNLNCT